MLKKVGSQAKASVGNDGRFIVCGGKDKLAQLIDLELKVCAYIHHSNTYNIHFLTSFSDLFGKLPMCLQTI